MFYFNFEQRKNVSWVCPDQFVEQLFSNCLLSGRRYGQIAIMLRSRRGNVHKIRPHVFFELLILLPIFLYLQHGLSHFPEQVYSVKTIQAVFLLVSFLLWQNLTIFYKKFLTLTLIKWHSERFLQSSLIIDHPPPVVVIQN